jgi:hypothetical protein
VHQQRSGDRNRPRRPPRTHRARSPRAPEGQRRAWAWTGRRRGEHRPFIWARDGACTRAIRPQVVTDSIPWRRRGLRIPAGAA